MSIDAGIDATRSRPALRLGLAVLGVALGLVLVRDAWNAHDTALDRLRQLEAELEDARHRVGHHEELAAQLADERSRLSEAERRLPGRFDRAALEQALREDARLAGAELAEVRFTNEETKEFHAALSASVLIRGPLENVLDCVARIRRETAPLRQLEWVRIEPDSEANTFHVGVLATYYRYVDDLE